MTDQELKDLVASLAVQGMETDRRMQETDRKMQETDRLFKELDKKLDKLCGKVGGIDDNQGYHAEQFFQDVFEKKLEFGGVKYDEMIPNLAHKSKKGEIEFDIALVNGNSVALIEVKNRIHPSFVKELAEERIEKFRKFFPEFKDYSAYLGIAGFSFSDEVIDRASAYGIGIVKQVGEGVEIKADNLKVY
ncbi:hypothetical protein R83H12_00720 [Fibrobacteria bacterium R8-3-H12]